MKIGRHRRLPFRRIFARPRPHRHVQRRRSLDRHSPFSSFRDANMGAPRAEFWPNEHQNA
jgi:hypothetical protein